MDIKLGESHDVLWFNGPLTKEYTTQPFIETVRQRLLIRLKTFLGEWAFNTVYGVPWWQEILGKKVSKSRVDLILQQQILSETGVKEITYFSSSFVNRVYSMTFRVRVSTGEETADISLSPTI